MPADMFICGSCHANFSDIDSFVQHKKEPCQPVNTDTEIFTESTNGNTETIIPLDVETLNNAVMTCTEPTDGSEPQTVIIIQGSSGESSDLSQTITMQGTFSTAEDGQTTFIPDPSATTTTAQDTIATVTQTPTPVGKKRGRPKLKGSARKQPEEKPPSKPSKPDIGTDGRFVCSSCKRSFTKERFFNTHKCMGTTDYVDLTRKQVIDLDLDVDDIEEDLESKDDHVYHIEEDHPSDVEEDEILDNDSDFKINEPQKSANEEGWDKVENTDGVQVLADPDVDNTRTEKPADFITDLPIFTSEEEKLKFEQQMNVDLSGVDSMFKQHAIAQDLNEKAPMTARMVTTSLSLFSCCVCEKIFKTLSHMRLHCLIHTDLKPFKCPKCRYASNSKGNLYTHMRKHTGQYYKCSECSFKSVNKSHLLEHVATHNKAKEKCDICKKTYKTLKSMINHIRKYHSSTERGREYLATFLQNPTKGSTVIHQCHVCNRKFKKKVDRDRHLFVHDIKDIPSIQHCELCDYTASRKVYLDKHYQKHRVIYRCVKCHSKFLSTIRLIDHLTSVHLKVDLTNKWEELFEQCINYSLYLPEPDELFEMKEFINLPPELSSSVMKNEAKLNTELGVMCSDKSSDAGDVNSGSGDVNSGSGDVTGDLMCTNKSLDTVDVHGGSGDVREDLVSVALQTSQGQVRETDSAAQVESSVSGQESLLVEAKALDNNDKESLQDTSKNVDNPDINDKEVTTSAEAMETETSGGVTETNNSDTVEEVGLAEGGLGEGSDDLDDNQLEELGDIDGTGESGGKGASKDLIQRMGYHMMTMDIFHKMRETFGTEECEYCGKLYYNKVDFDTHLRTHTGDKPFPCNICGYRGLTKENLSRHKEKEHEKLTFPCKDCNNEFVANSRSQLWNHTMKHRGLHEAMGIECPTCKSKFENMKKLKAHFSNDHPDLNLEEQLKVTGYKEFKHRTQGKMGRRSYKCPYCDKVFIRANSELQKHIWIHEGIKPYKCPLCTYACRSKNNLQAHMLRHTEEKPYSCSECGKAYKSQTALRWHVRSHKDGKLFKCTRCPYEATQRSHLKRHLQTHDVVKRFMCMHCEFSANTIGYMKIHYTRHHKGETFEYPNTSGVEVDKRVVMVDSQAYRCLSCDYLFGNMSDLKRHLKIRHHLQVQQIQGLDQVPVSEVQVLQCTDDALASTIVEQIAEGETTADVVEPSQTMETNDLDEKTQSAVSILQQIIDMSQQGGQPFTVQGEDGQMVSVNPETIIVQQEGEEVLLTEGGSGLEGNQQYVIQYVTPEEAEFDQLDQASLVEVQTVPEEVETIQTSIVMEEASVSMETD
ncbi:zinc finger protein ZFAT-like [Ylistrum balloti]|uniref:zinc finger protein ZFAT-like n=1 Tax=Ylistrum balloti TaxID=509963 RepID=UPI002905C42F|nr:zinc finger protein ZFAT-like [Ylistrum balloti]XP_060077017.1 zinc finger protein ZFAT-like [Ylistrum balloti]